MSAISYPDLAKSYALQSAWTYSEAIQHARKYMHAEDVLKVKQLLHQTTTSKFARAKAITRNQRKINRTKIVNKGKQITTIASSKIGPCRLMIGDCGSLIINTPLNIPLAEILANIENSNLNTMLERLGKMKLSLDKMN